MKKEKFKLSYNCCRFCPVNDNKVPTSPNTGDFLNKMMEKNVDPQAWQAMAYVMVGIWVGILRQQRLFTRGASY